MLSQNAETVLQKRYYLRNAEGVVIETSEEMFRRVANFLAIPEADAELWAERFYERLSRLEFVPNSPTLANANARTGQLAACFVLPVPDDLAGIFNTIRDAALIHQTGGGTGFAYSRLRPKNDFVGGNQGVSSGPVSFMDVFNAATESIKQGGLRRGANMGILRVDHPDILEFVAHKEDLSKLNNFNISVAITDEFMQCLADNEPFALRNPRTSQITGWLDPKSFWTVVIEKAHNTGEPGVVFIDRMNKDCPVPWLGEYEATNPCGEQPLIPNEACNLGSINLEKFVLVDEANKPFIDWFKLSLAVEDSVRFLDNVIDQNVYPIAAIKEVTTSTRKIGLGVMGFARMCFMLNIRYGSPESLVLAEQVMSFIDFHSKKESIGLSRRKGQFPARAGHEEESNAFYERLCLERNAQELRHPGADYGILPSLIKLHGIRNSTTTTIAPTGTISIIADTSSGCEPIFSLAFIRNQAGETMMEVDRLFVAALEKVGIGDSHLQGWILEQIAEHHGSLREALNDEAVLKLLQDETIALLLPLAEIFVTAHDITPREHVLIQAAFQKYNDSATSKTINFPESATLADVREAYELAWELGCKGITIYRNNSRSFQPLSNAKKDEPPASDSPCGCDAPNIVATEGCETCMNCGWSACSIK